MTQLPGPAPRGRSPDHAAALNQSCTGCHLEIAQEWRQSLHASSHTDPVYQRAYAIEPLAFCQGCHAPEADADAPVPPAAAALGVGCVTCHVLGEAIASAGQGEAASRWNGSARGHAVLRDPRLATGAACAGCHEFEFPDRGARRHPELMQSTLSEHARSNHRDTSCADCHMPRLDGAAHRSHVFAGGRDPALVSRAASVTARRRPAGASIVITPAELGHAFPTGDLFRRLAVSAEVVGADWQVLASAERYLTRHFERQPSPFGVVLRRVVTDDRPLAAPVKVELGLGPAATGRPIQWRVAYQRIEHPRSDAEQDSVIEGEIEIASGTLESEP